MATVYIPAPLRNLAQGQTQVVVEGESVRQVLVALGQTFPGLAARLACGEGLAPGLAVSVDGVMTNRGLAAKVGPASEVHFLPAIGGG